MIPIANIRFEPPVGFQTLGGPVWKSEIISLASGAETRNGQWARPLRKWTLVGVPVSETEARNLVRFFNARSGALQGFRFADPFGASTALPGNVISPIDEVLGEGDGVTRDFQLSLDDGAETRRRITRPVAGRVRVAVNGAEISAFTLNDETGTISFSVPPPMGAVLTAGFAYDTPVRFETDTIELAQSSVNAFQLVRLALTELREGQ